jgi:hypothetical protein
METPSSLPLLLWERWRPRRLLESTDLWPSDRLDAGEDAGAPRNGTIPYSYCSLDAA